MVETAAPRPALAGRRGQDPAVMDARGPGSFFCDHPGRYALSLAGALGTAGYAAVQARKAESGRTRWWALAGLTATQAVGMAASRRRARAAGDGNRQSPRHVDQSNRRAWSPDGYAARADVPVGSG
jgi:hypothetical protein